MADQKIIAEIGANLKKMPSTKSEAILLGCVGFFVILINFIIRFYCKFLADWHSNCFSKVKFSERQ